MEEKEILADIRKTTEANILQKRKADESEAIVQHALVKAAKKRQIPITVLRGINTYKDVFEYLQDLGIHCSKLGGFSASKKDASSECEHDILVLAMLQSKLIVSFIQVIYAYFVYFKYCTIMFRLRQRRMKSHGNPI